MPLDEEIPWPQTCPDHQSNIGRTTLRFWTKYNSWDGISGAFCLYSLPTCDVARARHKKGGQEAEAKNQGRNALEDIFGSVSNSSYQGHSGGSQPSSATRSGANSWTKVCSEGSSLDALKGPIFGHLTSWQLPSSNLYSLGCKSWALGVHDFPVEEDCRSVGQRHCQQDQPRNAPASPESFCHGLAARRPHTAVASSTAKTTRPSAPCATGFSFSA